MTTAVEESAVSTVIVEHLVMAAHGPDVVLGCQVAELPHGANPVSHAQAAYPGSFAHSTSWRWTDAGVVLTFAHVLNDDSSLPPGLDTVTLSAYDLERHQVACHAVRHLHFLQRTDENVASLQGFDDFWAFASAVADYHYPAVAGLLQFTA
jgi:hypothetical protein